MKLVAEPERCCRWNSGHGWGWAHLIHGFPSLFQSTVCDSRSAAQDGLSPVLFLLCQALFSSLLILTLNSRIIVIQGNSTVSISNSNNTCNLHVLIYLMLPLKVVIYHQESFSCPRKLEKMRNKQKMA